MKKKQLISLPMQNRKGVIIVKENKEQKYEKPNMDIWRLDLLDVITTSQQDMSYNKVTDLHRWTLDF